MCSIGVCLSQELTGVNERSDMSVAAGHIYMRIFHAAFILVKGRGGMPLTSHRSLASHIGGVLVGGAEVCLPRREDSGCGSAGRHMLHWILPKRVSLHIHTTQSGNAHMRHQAHADIRMFA